LVLTGVRVSNFFIYSNFDLIFNTQNKCIDLKPGYVKKILVSPSPNHSKKLSMLYVIFAVMSFLIIFRFVGSLKGRLTDRQEGRKAGKKTGRHKLRLTDVQKDRVLKDKVQKIQT
jgi:hypothetical protein